LQVSAFEDLNPRAFGLMQRQKSFAVYQDLESHFERRPSLSIEPIGDWGEGSVVLFEIPTKEEVHDNIVAFWRPKEPAVAKREYTYTYRMHWGPDIPKTDEVARFVRTGVSALADDSKQFVLEIVGDKLKTIDPKLVKGVVSADKSTISNIVTQPNPETGGWRLSFQLATKDQSPIELRASLMDDATTLSEVWTYRWTA
jgi:glucans biosynthesis protein